MPHGLLFDTHALSITPCESYVIGEGKKVLADVVEVSEDVANGLCHRVFLILLELGWRGMLR